MGQRGELRRILMVRVNVPMDSRVKSENDKERECHSLTNDSEEIRNLNQMPYFANAQGMTITPTVILKGQCPEESMDPSVV